MNLVAVYNRQPAIRSSGLLRGALVTAQRSGDGKSDRFLVLELDNSLIRKFRATHPRPLPGGDGRRSEPKYQTRRPNSTDSLGFTSDRHRWRIRWVIFALADSKFAIL